MKWTIRKDWRFIINKWILRRHEYEYGPRKCMRKIKGDIFVDIGANHGLYSIVLHKNFRKVYAVEPNPSVLKEWKERPENVTIIPIALSNKSGSARLYLDVICPSILSPFDYMRTKPEWDRSYMGQEFIEVPTQTYDTVFGKADLVKIDVEGAEFLVLQGMEKSLELRMVKNILVEVHDRNRKNEMELLLRGHGFSTRWVDGDHIYGFLDDDSSTSA